MIIPSLNSAETRTIENMDSTAVVASHFGLTQTPLNAVDDHAGAQSPPASGPTEGARGATVPLTGYARTKEMVEERLADRRDYQELKTTLSQAEQLASDFALVEANSLCAGDGVLVWADILAVANDTLRPDSVRQAAARLRDNPTVWEGFAKGDNRASTGDVAAFIASLKSQMKAIRDEVSAEVKADVKAEQGAATPGPGPAGANSGGAAATGQQSATSQIPRPPPSDRPGMDGATENLANTADYLQQQMMALADEASKDPSKATLNAQKIAMLQNQFQSVTNMMNQMTQMLSNLSKMWSDVAMNSIRNLK